MVGQGVSYTEAADRTRVRNHRSRLASGAQLVGNWVEVLTPIVAATHRESEWPETIVCDSTSFLVLNRRTGYRSLAFNVLAVWGYPAGRARGRLWALSASHRATTAEWSELFDTLPGTPTLVVADRDGAIHAALRNRWPRTTQAPQDWSPLATEPFVKWCEHHLYELALKNLGRYGLDKDPTARVLLGQAFKTPQGWQAFRDFAADHIQLDAWCARNDSWVTPQTTWRTRLPDHHANGAVEKALQQVIGLIGQRAYSFRNRYRTNQLLELARLRINGAADEAAYAGAIRQHLNTGGPLRRQLSCADHGTRPRQRGQRVARASLRT